jgi:hypothetical protein
MNQILSELESEALAQGREWTRRQLEERLQAQAEELTTCPDSGLKLKQIVLRPFSLLSVSGTITIRAPYGFSTQTGQWVCPARRLWGLEAHQRLSPLFEQRLAYNAVHTGSYEKASEMAGCWGSPISDDTIHAVIERRGARASSLEPPPMPPRPLLQSAPVFNLVIMLDGWMVRERGRQWGTPPHRETKERVEWHEVKSAVIYRLEQRVENASGRGLLLEKNVVACAPGTDPVDFGAAVQKEAMRCGLAQAKEVFVIADGAVWIWRLIADRFATATQTLDFYHASEHLWALAHHLYPANTQAAAQWVEPLLHQLRHDPDHRLIESLEELLAPDPAENLPPDPFVEGKVNYFRPHRDHLNYAKLAARGAPIGSGAMESACSQFQNRFKRRGQFWSREGLRHLLAVDVAAKNRTLTYLWN